MGEGSVQPVVFGSSGVLLCGGSSLLGRSHGALPLISFGSVCLLTQEQAGAGVIEGQEATGQRGRGWCTELVWNRGYD